MTLNHCLMQVVIHSGYAYGADKCITINNLLRDHSLPGLL